TTNTWNDYLAIGRLSTAGTQPAAQAQMDAASRVVEQVHPDLKGWRAQLFDLRELNAGDSRSALLVLVGAVTFVLLIASANVANLLLARGTARASEIAVRKALGAGRWRVIRQLLIESALLATAGGTLGVTMVSLGIGALQSLAPSHLANVAPGLSSAALNTTVLFCALGISAWTTILFGLAPAWLNAKPSVADTLKETARGALHPRSHRFRSALLVSQVGLALVLLVGAGLMIRTLRAMSAVDLGFNPANVLTLRVPLEAGRYKDPERVIAFWQDVLRRVETMPGVSSASVSRGLPIEGWSGQFFTTEDRQNPQAGQVPDANYVVIGPHYFETMQIPLRAGRRFDDHDTRAATPVVIVNEELARQQWPGQSALGKRLRMGSPVGNGFSWLTVVGVAGNALSTGPHSGVRAEVYVPYQQTPWLLTPQHLVIRSAPAMPPASLARAVVEELRHIDRDLPAADIQTMETVAGIPMGQQQMVLALLGGFAAVALVLAALGIYSVLSYAIGQRRREIGVRVALGAQQRDVLRLVVGGGAKLTMVGIGVGLVTALALTRLM
ncbi:MAG TPA: FtsX-like permease family protein, partial [Chloroflexota bacterium]|nr:FtsX-like permease family protein [Chloroflexota bacterium]